MLFAASSPPQLSCKSHCRHVGADSLEMETRGKGGRGFVTIALTLTKSSLSCRCLVVTPQCHVSTLSRWRWSSRCPGYETATVVDPEIGPGGNSVVCSCKSPPQLGNQAGPHPNERLLQSTSVFGSRHHLQWELWSIPQLAVGSVIYGKRQMLALALLFS